MKDAEGPCQIRVAPGLGFLGQGLSGVRSCSLVGFWGMTPAQQGGENDPLTRRVVLLDDFPAASVFLHGFASTCCTQKKKTPPNLPLLAQAHTRGFGRKPLPRTSREPLKWRLFHLYIFPPPLANLSRPVPEVGSESPFWNVRERFKS
jgi:hypothetical protein